MKSTAEGRPELIRRRYAIPAFLALVAAGLAGNWFTFEIFFNIEFIFGSIFSMLALQAFGLGPGVLAAAIVSTVTWSLWNHPYAIVIMSCEVLVAGYLHRRKGISLVSADALFWAFIGIPLGFLFFTGVMGLAADSAAVTSVKQTLNGIGNTLAARLIFVAVAAWRRSIRFSLREMVLNILALFMLVPSLVLLAIQSRADFAATDSAIRGGIAQASRRAVGRVESWLRAPTRSLSQLAGVAGVLPAREIQPALERLLAEKDFQWVGLMDTHAVSVACAPPVDELGASNVGRSFADRSYLPVLERELRPLFTEVVTGRFGVPAPMVAIVAPVIKGGAYAGYVGGVIDLRRLREVLDLSIPSQSLAGVRYALVDKGGRIIVTTIEGRRALEPFSRARGHLLPRGDGVAEWVPDSRRNISVMARWQDSLFVTEAAIGGLSGWRIILEQPFASFEQAFVQRYVGLMEIILALFMVTLGFAEFASRRFVASLERLKAFSTDLPARLSRGERTAWSAGTVVEIEGLADNFQQAAGALADSFMEIRAANAALETKVEERTQELRESEVRYRSLFENHHSVMLLIDPEDGAVLDANPAASAWYGWSREELRRMTISQINLMSPGEVAAEMALAKKDARGHFFFKHRRSEGRVSEVEVYSGPVEIAGKTLLFSNIHDVTGRKAMEEALRESRLFLEETQGLAKLGGWRLDVVTGRISWTAEVYRIYGVGMDFDPSDVPAGVSFYAPQERQTIARAFRRAVDCGESYDLELRFTRANGEHLWVRTICNPVTRDGKVVTLTGTIMDITKRKQAEELVRRALQEKEVLLKEIHHRVKNNMQVICSLLNLQAKGIADGRVRAIFEQSRDRVNAMALIHEKLYRSGDLAHIDFKVYLQSLVHGIADSHGRGEIDVFVDMERLELDVNAGIPCGLIVNELVSNSFKHAFPAGRNGTVRVGMSCNAAGGYVLTVRDDGVGFPPEVDFRNTSSLGLQLVNVLVGQIRGTIELEWAAGTGFVIAFPGPAAAGERHDG